MALGAPETDERNATDNRSQDYYDEKFNDLKKELSGQENGAIPGYDRKNDGLDDHPISGGDASGKSGDIGKNINDIDSAEKNPNAINFTGSNSPKQKSAGKGNLLKRKGPTGVIIGFLLAALGIGGSFGVMGLLPIHIMESFTQKFDTQNTSATVRSNRVFVNKLVGESTTGSCNVVKIACRFPRPSNYLLNNLAKNNFVALDSAGNPINTRTLWPNAQPKEYQFTDSTGKKLPPIKASELSGALKNNAELRAAFHKAYNPRWITWTDSVAKSVFTRWGVSKQDKLANAKDEASANKTINEASKGRDIGANTEEPDSFLKKLLTAKAADAIEKVRKAGKGSAVLLTAGAVCLTADTPKLITSVARAYQLAQVISFAMAILTPTSAAKAGDGKVAAMAAIGSFLTTTKDGKSAMDSFGMQNALFGATKPGKDSNYKKFSPGGSVIANTGSTIQITDSQLVKNSCSVATNPVTGTAINIALVANSGETLGATAVIAGLNVALGAITSEVIKFVAPLAIDAAMPMLQPVIKQVLGAFLGDFTQNLVGQDRGDAFASGASNFMGQTANAGGNIPLTVSQAVGYNKVAQDTQLAYAQEDRATLSPLDTSSSNTVMGSIVDKFLPYYGQMGSISGILSSIGTITTSSFGSLFGKSVSAADDGTAQYQLCDDPAVSQSSIAAGPFCNIYYGVPQESLGTDPNVVLQYMLDNNQINDESGDPIPDSEYDTYMQTCTDGTTDQLDSCAVSTANDADTQKKIAMYSLWTIDHRIQKTMDNQDTVIDTSTTTQDTSNTSTGTVNPNGWAFPTTAGAPVTSPFGPRGGGFHTGVDFGVPSGSPFYATRDGVVTTREYNVYTVNGDGGAWCPVLGSMTDPNQKDIWIKSTVDGKTYTSIYAHMSKYLKKTGDTVKAGELIGYTGGSGCSSGPHVHFEIWQSGSPTPSIPGPGLLDPLPLITK